jgi:hypothetical protein
VVSKNDEAEPSFSNTPNVTSVLSAKGSVRRLSLKLRVSIA